MHGIKLIISALLGERLTPEETEQYRSYLEPPELLSNLAESIPKSDKPRDTLWTDNMQRTDFVPIFGWLEDEQLLQGQNPWIS